jgi:glycosyltransferase involved in cell wall biosynthesis
MTTVDDPIRVLRVIARLNVGGPALHVSYLTRELDERGYETRLVAGRVGRGEGSMEYVAAEQGIEVRYVDALQREIEPLADLRAALRLRRLIRTWRPQVLHTHTAKAGAVGRLAALLSGSARPRVVVHTFHGHVLRGYFGPLKAFLFRRLETMLAHSTDALIAVSSQVRDDLVRLGVAPSERISVIRLGLDLDARLKTDDPGGTHVRSDLGIAARSFVVGWFGRMTGIKRVDVLLDAFAALRAAGVDAQLLLVGDGPLRAELENHARVLEIDACVHFVGFQDDIGAYLEAVDGVALTSANEGTPVTLIEASAAKRPVVSTAVGGVPDVVLEGVTGFLVPDEDSHAVADRLRILASDPELRRQMGEAGARHVRATYSVPRLVDEIDALYRDLLELPPRRFAHGRVTELVPPALGLGSTRAIERPLRILLLSQYFPPEIGATQSRMQAFAEYLAARGHDVTVICEMPNHPQGIIPRRYRGLLVADDSSNDYRVLRVRVMASPEKTQRTRMAFYLSYMSGAAAVGSIVERPDVVFATSPPLFAGAAGLAIARSKRAPFVLDVRDLWPAAAVSLRQIGGGASLAAAEWLERRLYRGAAAVTAVTQPFCSHIDGIRGSNDTVLLPNGTLDLFFDDVPAVDRTELGVSNGSFLVIFAGMHGIAQALPTVLDAAEQLGPKVDFALVGDGPIKPFLVEAANARNLENVHFHDQMPLERMPAVLSAGDALLVPLSAHPTFRSFVPSKLLDFMAVGRPVVLSAGGEAERMLEAAHAGVTAKPEDAESLSDAIESLLADPAAASAYGESGRAFARSRTRSVQAERLEALLLDVVRSHNPG